MPEIQIQSFHLLLLKVLPASKYCLFGVFKYILISCVILGHMIVTVFDLISGLSAYVILG